jgi:hypothetical protein
MESKYVTRMWAVDDLHPASYNPRKITPERLAELKRSMSIDPDFLHARPVIVNVHPDRRGIIVGGNMRWLAAKELGLSAVPCVEVNLELTRERAWNLRDNAHAGDWDMDALADLLKVDAPAFEATLPDDMMKGLLAACDPPTPDEGESEEPKKPAKKSEVTCPECSYVFVP